MALKAEEFRHINSLSEAELKQYLLDEAYRPQMIDYFGEEEYESLKEILTTPAHFAGAGAEIILLPGIMGSELADETGPFGKVWVDCVGFLGGEFTILRLDAVAQNDMTVGSRLVPVGLYKSAYFKTQKWLEGQGYTVHPFAYDWRRPIDVSARRLWDFVETKVHNQPNKQFIFVAHSMGGLVVRRCLDLFGTPMEDRLDKLIMLGTPNNGSFVPPMAMKGDYPFIKVAGVLYGNAQTRAIVQSFPGLYEMYPNPAIFEQSDIYQFDYWNEPEMSATHLDAALQFHKKLKACLPDKMFLIANRSLKTITTVLRESKEGGWQYRFFGRYTGDGTVPFDSAYLRDVPTYETEVEHGYIQKDERVLHAIRDLIEEGQTDRLDRYVSTFAPPTDSDSLEEITPDEVALKL